VQNVLFKTDQFCKTLNLNCEKNLSILKFIVNSIAEKSKSDVEEENFIIHKLPLKQVLRL